MRLFWTVALASAFPGPSLAQPAAPPPRTLQQEFDAASDAAISGKCEAAIAMFGALQRDPGLKPGSLAEAAVWVRKGNCLIRVGRTGEGEAAILRGLPSIRKAGASFTNDLIDAFQSLGDAALGRSEYAEARKRFTEALSHERGDERLAALAGLAKATAFDGGTASIDYADEALRILAATAAPDKALQATFYTLRARALLNQGRTTEAYNDLKIALDLSGGLTLKTTASEQSMRGDLALAATLLGKDSDARRYLAYTGQGRISESPFGRAEQMAAPNCEDFGLKPADFAVVEFGIGSDGLVTAAQTVFTRGGPATAAAFAQALRDWFWTPATIAKIPPFYRANSRVEIRCTTGSNGQFALKQAMVKPFTDWATPKLTYLTPALDALPDRIAAVEKTAAEAAAAGNIEGQLAATGFLLTNSSAANQALLDRFDRVMAQAKGSSVPVNVMNSLRIFRMLAAQTIRRTNTYRPDQRQDRQRQDRQELLDLASDPALGDDVAAVATLRLLATDIDRTEQRSAEDLAILRSVAEDPRFQGGHPLRQYALLTLANDAAARDDLAQADALFQRTGLTEEQCALIGPVPALKKIGAKAEYPVAALNYGFDGWVRLEFDIGPDGKAQVPRALIAYPPFVFGESAAKMAQGFVFARSYRPSASVACSARNHDIRFIVGGTSEAARRLPARGPR